MSYNTYNITDDWQVSADQYCYTLRRRLVVKEGDNKGVEYWVNDGFYGTIGQLLNRLLNVEAMANVGDLNTIIDRMDAIEKHLDVLVKIKEEREGGYS